MSERSESLPRRCGYRAQLRESPVPTRPDRKLRVSTLTWERVEVEQEEET
jgi:hypothetical protein